MAPEEISRIFGLDHQTLERVTSRFPARINPYFLSLIQEPKDPIGRQVVPDPMELEDEEGSPDPLAEESFSPVPYLIHRYPDRVVLLASSECAIHCRFCNRRRRVGRKKAPGPQDLEPALQYVRAHREVRDVLISGGDPLLLEDAHLEGILSALRGIAHVQILRIGTRVPSALPYRINHALCRMLRRHHPLYMSLHFNHPRELTSEARRACAMLADSGIPLGSQTVLLRGVNDDPAVIAELMRALVSARVRPYYLFQLDPVKGSAHLRTPVEKGIQIVRELQRLLPLIWIPQFAVDLPGGGGKALLGPGCTSGADLVY